MNNAKGFIWGLILCIVLSLFASCKSVKNIPVENTKKDSVFVNSYRHDSIYIRDSIFVNKWAAGDTIFQDKVVFKYVYRDKIKYDTINILRTDSINVPYPVERRLNSWEKIRIVISDLIKIAVIVTIVIAGYSFFKTNSSN